MLVICASTAPNLAEGKKPKEADKAQPDQHVEDQFGTYNKQFLLRYIDSIGRRLNAQLPTGEYDFRFRIVDQAEPNAFALPSGYIYLSRGLLALINSEDELAAIAAHAMSHITLEHTARQGEQYVSPESMSLPETALRQAIAENLSELFNTPVAVPGAAPLSAYDLNDELQADRAGMKLAAEAGYDPKALGVVLDTIARATELFPDFQARSFFDPHPISPERLSRIDELANQIAWTPGQPFARNKAALL
jgi:predicted Zn-dependent protease